MKAGDTKPMQRVRRAACGCVALRTVDAGTTTEPMFQVTQGCDDHMAAVSAVLRVFVVLDPGEEVTELEP